MTKDQVTGALLRWGVPRRRTAQISIAHRDVAGDIIAKTTTDGSENTVTTKYGPGIVMNSNYCVIEQDLNLPSGFPE